MVHSFVTFSKNFKILDQKRQVLSLYCILCAINSITNVQFIPVKTGQITCICPNNSLYLYQVKCFNSLKMNYKNVYFIVETATRFNYEKNNNSVTCSMQ